MKVYTNVQSPMEQGTKSHQMELALQSVSIDNNNLISIEIYGLHCTDVPPPSPTLVNISYGDNYIIIYWQSDSTLSVEVQVNCVILECATETGGGSSDYKSLPATTITNGTDTFTMQVKNNTNYTFSLIAVKSENEKSDPTVVNYTTPESGRSMNLNPTRSNIDI